MDWEIKNQETPQILIVDDLKMNILFLREIIEGMGYIPLTAANGKEALQIVRTAFPQVILMDISMPEMSGYEVCEILKKNKRTRDIPVIFISAMDSSESKIKGFKAGAVDFITKPFEPLEVTMRIENHLKMYRLQEEMKEYNYKLNCLVNEQMKRIEAEQKNILYALAKVTEGRDNSIKNHLENIRYNSRLLAQSLQFSHVFEKEITTAFIEKIGVAAMLHDIGKIQISDEILLKPGQLSREERKVINQHTEIGAHILEEIHANTESNDFLPMAITIARYHHEKWDGTGYPEGLKEREIPLSARIVSLIDIFDTLTGERCYKMAYTIEQSLLIIEECKGIYFDPDIVEVFMKIQKQLRHN
ncbi:MAG: response regulator [Clostridiales bacterium]|nr:response regulator [Clostridiales bacterium]